MTPASPPASVLDEVATWPGVSALSADQRTEVLAAGGAKKWFSDWVSKPLANETDAQDGIALLRKSYDELRAP